MSTASTHVLDAARGLPAVGLEVRMTGPLPDAAPVASGGTAPGGVAHPGERPASGTRTAVTDADGRIAWGALPAAGRYALTFATGPWFAAQDRDTFFPQVTLDVTLGDAHTHVALLLSPFAYTTYRGS
ncbi:hydroxyisourate hydrolase [Antribacter gilvus]|uniref:hydroxyisourate hydrolase n=1 Tax=Antribacter gilvus TaxID=2304675 RepID=UPI000F78A4FC|nr:hydroxyisourate hydrolase [Antribacter gilvus]